MRVPPKQARRCRARSRSGSRTFSPAHTGSRWRSAGGKKSPRPLRERSSCAEGLAPDQKGQGELVGELWETWIGSFGTTEGSAFFGSPSQRSEANSPLEASRTRSVQPRAGRLGGDGGV